MAWERARRPRSLACLGVTSAPPGRVPPGRVASSPLGLMAPYVLAPCVPRVGDSIVRVVTALFVRMLIYQSQIDILSSRLDLARILIVGWPSWEKFPGLLHIPVPVVVL